MVFHYSRSGPIGGHLGVLKTIQKIQHFVWKGMAADIREREQYCKTCEAVNRHNLVSGHHNWHSGYITGYLLVTLESFLEVKQDILCC
jgi:hypothetical protein